MAEKKFLTPHQLTERWGGEIHERTLANWRFTGKGPRFIKIGGRVLYEIDEVESWEKRRTVQSTAEYDKFE